MREALRDLWHPPSRTIGGLDALRTLAILLVISVHWTEHATRHGSTLAINRLPLFNWGWTGVDLFFILSGYLIGSQLWRELQRSGTVDVPRFLLRRGLRIWPYYFAFIAFALVVAMMGIANDGDPAPWRRFIPDALFFSNYVRGAVSGGWSLSTEEQFYIAIPLLLLLFRRMPLKHHWILMVSLMLLLPLSRLHAVQAFGREPGPDEVYVIYAPIHTRADGLLFGLLLAWFHVVKPWTLAPRPVIRNALVPLALVVSGGVLHSIDKTMFSYLALALIYGAITLFVLRDRSPIERVLRWRGFHIGSRLSYAMYLNHFALIAWLPLNPGIDLPGFFSGYLEVIVTSLAVAVVTFVLVEAPFLRLRKRWLDRPPRGAAVIAGADSNASS